MDKDLNGIKNQNHTKAKITIIVLSIVAVLLIAGLVTLSIIYMNANKELNDKKTSYNTSQKQLSSTKAQLADANNQLTNAKNQIKATAKQVAELQTQVTAFQDAANKAPKYLALANWGVKFLMPTGLTTDQVQYEPADDGNSFLFTTTAVSALGGTCRLTTTEGSIEPLGSITRVSTNNSSLFYMYNGNNDIMSYITSLNGYDYWYVKMPNEYCSNSNINLQTQDTAKIRNLLFAIMVN